MKKGVMIITFDMIPNSKTWGGCQRMYYLAKEIRSQGTDITVLSFDKMYSNTFGHDLTFKAIPLKSKNIISNKFINLGSTVTNEGNGKGDLKKSKISSKFKLVVKKAMNILEPVDRFLYNEPQMLKGWISSRWASEYFGYFCEQIKSNNIETVIISAPPFGLLSVAPKLKKQFGKNINVIIDYRDPWNLWKKGSLISSKKEMNALNAADKIVVTNEFYGKDLCETYNLSMDKINVISNGYSHDDWNKAKIIDKSKSKVFKISFVGSIALTNEKSYRNCNNLLEAFDKFRGIYSDVILEFIGVSNIKSDFVVDLEKKFKNNISIKGIVSSIQAIEYMQDSDVLLLIHTANDNSSKYLVSGKLYDYIRSGRPILSIGDLRGNHHKLINEYNLGFSVEDNVDNIFECLLQLYKSWENDSLDYFNSIKNPEEFSREYQNKKYFNLIDKNGGVK